MTIRYERETGTGLVVAEIEESVPVADMREFLHQVATDPAHQSTDPMLVRVLSLTRIPPIGDTRLMIAELRARTNHFRGPIAVVTPTQSILITTRMAASLCRLAGFDVEAFTDVGDARRWLALQTSRTSTADVSPAEASPRG